MTDVGMMTMAFLCTGIAQSLTLQITGCKVQTSTARGGTLLRTAIAVCPIQSEAELVNEGESPKQAFSCQ